MRGRGWTHETGHISFDHSLHPRFSHPVEGGWRREGGREGRRGGGRDTVLYIGASGEHA